MSISIERLQKEMDYLKQHKIEIGILGNGESVPGKYGGTKKEITVLEYGIFLEFGTSKMQPFGYFRRAINENSKNIRLTVEGALNDVMSGRITGKEAYMQVGEYIRGLIIQSIASAGSWARELSPDYKKWKTKKYPNRAEQTLILDGFLIKSIRYQIKKGNTIEYTSDWANI